MEKSFQDIKNEIDLKLQRCGQLLNIKTNIMNVRAKFKCTEVILIEGQTGVEIHLEPVCSGSEENERFFSYTPWGRIVMGTVNEEAAKEFEADKEYYVDFSRAE